MLWFPELFNRYEKFEHLYPGQKASVCDVSALRPSNQTVVAVCSGEVNPAVFSHTLIIGLASIPSSLAMPLLVHKMGAKWFLGELFGECNVSLNELGLDVNSITLSKNFFFSKMAAVIAALAWDEWRWEAIL